MIGTMANDEGYSPGDRLDRFRLEKLLGKGAFGQVWLAVDEGGFGFEKRVALKILLDIENEDRVDALIREARICAGLNHPNVIDVYGVGEADGVVYVVMEYVEGETLASLWRDLEYMEVPFPRSIVCDLGIAVAEALHHAWTAKNTQGDQLAVVHRDLKPANIMVSVRGVAKVGDFGVAKALPEPSDTMSGRLKGTPSYLAPEVWQGTREFKPTVDLWGLGVILWELTVGRRFFGKVKVAQIFGILADRDPADEAAGVAERFPPLAPIVEHLLQRDPAKRPQTALEVAEALRAVRQELGPGGDLLQFMRLVRAGRLEPEHRHDSLAAFPALPKNAEDWLPLLEVAAEDLAKAQEEQPEPAEQLRPGEESVDASPAEVEPPDASTPPDEVPTDQAPAVAPAPQPPPPAPVPVAPMSAVPASSLSAPPPEPLPRSGPPAWLLAGAVLFLLGTILWLISLLRG